MLTRENIVPSNLHYALVDLSRLLSNVHAILSDMEFVRQDGTRNDELDAVSSLINIGSAQIENLADACLRFDMMEFDQPAKDTVSRSIIEAMENYADKDAIFRASADLPENDCDPDWEAQQAAENVLISTPCITLADVRAKAELAIKDENFFDSITNCRDADGHVGIKFLKSIINAETCR